MRGIRILSIIANFSFLAAAQEQDKPIWICPFARCSKCPTTAEAKSSGIGFALEMGYGTVAIRHDDGSYETVAKILGSEPYVSLMRELTQPANFTPDGMRIPDGMEWQDWALWRAKRRMNKMMGRPATPQASGLSDMVSQLREAAQTRLGARVEAAVLSLPDYVTVMEEEVDDVFDYLGIKNLMPDKWDPLFSQLFATSAAYAGYGKGLCQNYTNVYGCETEEYFLPSRWTLFLDYSQDSLSGGFDHIGKARTFGVRNKFFEPSLGLQQLSAYKNEDVYWAKVANRIRDFVKSTRRDVQELVLTGESASDQRFHIALRHALAEFSSGQGSVDLQGQKTFGISNQNYQPDFLYATAIGAAEFAKRRQEGMARCLLPEKCRGNRRLEKETAASLPDADYDG